MPIPTKCPHCGLESNVDDKYAGTSGPCRQCGETITVAGTQNPFAADAGATAGNFAGVPPTPPRSRSKIPVVAIVAALAFGLLMCGGILTALLLPAVQAARAAAQRNMCSNQLRQIQLAILNYESANGHMPPAYIADENGKPMHSWRVLILPYMEEAGVFKQYNMDEPWDSPSNLALTQGYTPPVYQCPSDPSVAGSTSNTSYVAVSGPNAAFHVQPRKMGDIKDGLSKSLSIVEIANSNIHWSEPRDWDVTQSSFRVNGGPNEIGSEHPGGAMAARMDGSVFYMGDDTDPETLEAMTTIDGGEPAMGF